MTRIFTPLIVGQLDNSTFIQLHEPFRFQSDVLKKAGLQDIIEGPAGFVFDFESVPAIIRGPVGTNKRGGTAHDILSRKGACPGITKAIGAAAYLEIMDYCDGLDTIRFAKSGHRFLPEVVIVPYVKTRDWSRRWMKRGVVRVWPGYWQKHELMATAMEIAGIEGDPYITVEKLDALKDAKEEIEAKK